MNTRVQAAQTFYQGVRNLFSTPAPKLPKGSPRLAPKTAPLAAQTGTKGKTLLATVATGGAALFTGLAGIVGTGFAALLTGVSAIAIIATIGRSLGAIIKTGLVAAAGVVLYKTFNDRANREPNAPTDESVLAEDNTPTVEPPEYTPHAAFLNVRPLATPRAVATGATHLANATSNIVRNGGSAALLAEIRRLAPLVKAGRLGSNIPLGGSVVAVGAGGGLSLLFHLQRSYARELHNENPEIMSEAALNSYLDLSHHNQLLLLGDLGISALDPTGLSIGLTILAENGTYNNFQEWVDGNASTLDPEIANSLSMSVFTPQTVKTDIINDIMGQLANTRRVTKETVPAALHSVIDVRDLRNTERASFIQSFTGANYAVQAELRSQGVDVMSAISLPTSRLEEMRQRALDRGRTEQADGYARVIEMRKPWDDASAAYTAELTRQLTTATGLQAGLSMLSANNRLELVQRLYQSEVNDLETARNDVNDRYNEITQALSFPGGVVHIPELDAKYDFETSHGEGFDASNWTQLIQREQLLRDRTLAAAETRFTQKMDTLAERHPEIAAYMTELEGDTWYRRMQQDDVLRENPELMDRYITDRFFPTSPDVLIELEVNSNTETQNRDGLGGEFELSSDRSSVTPREEPTETAALSNSVAHSLAGTDFLQSTTGTPIMSADEVKTAENEATPANGSPLLSRNIV